MNVISLGKTVLQRYPGLLQSASLIYNHTIGWNKIKINGCGNSLVGYSFLKHSNITIIGNNNCIDFGSSCLLDGCRLFIQGNNNRVILGEKNYLKNADFWIEDDMNYISVGNKTSVHGFTHLAATEGKRIIIGNDCMFSSDVTIRTGDSHSIVDKDSRTRENHARDVIIGNHVWVGNKTIILKGAAISNNSVIATGAVVTNTFEQGNIILGGNPARVIKENIDWLRERI